MKLVNRTLAAFALLSASLRAGPLAQPVRASGQKADTGSSMVHVATVIERVERDRRDIRVYEAGRLIDFPWFTELAVAIPVDPRGRLDSLLGGTVGLVATEKPLKEWSLFSNVVGIGGPDRLTLAENVFRVRKVIRCTPQHAVELRVDGWVYRMKPGQVLLVLG